MATSGSVAKRFRLHQVCTKNGSSTSKVLGLDIRVGNRPHHPGTVSQSPHITFSHNIPPSRKPSGILRPSYLLLPLECAQSQAARRGSNTLHINEPFLPPSSAQYTLPEQERLPSSVFPAINPLQPLLECAQGRPSATITKETWMKEELGLLPHEASEISIRKSLVN